jgi:Uma2 family endonuclease
MADAAQRRMSVEEFLAWEGGGDTRYQLRDGVAVAMAPPAPAHGALVANLVAQISNALRNRPSCVVQTEVGVRSPSNVRSFHQVDIGVSCVPLVFGAQEIAEPVLMIEVLSPSSADDDRDFKLPDYRMLASVQEIVLINSRRRICEVHRRGADDRWIVDLLRRPEDRLRLETVGLDVPLSTVYANVPLEEAS